MGEIVGVLKLFELVRPGNEILAGNLAPGILPYL